MRHGIKRRKSFYEYVCNPRQGNLDSHASGKSGEGSIMFGKSNRGFKIFVFLICISAFTWLGLARFYRLDPLTFMDKTARVMLAPVFFVVYHEDIKAVRKIVGSYYVGDTRLLSKNPAQTWKKMDSGVPGFRLLGSNEGVEPRLDIPFVYEKMDSGELVEFRKRWHLEKIISGPGDESDAMLRLAAWLGTRWDHGTDKVPGGDLYFNPADVVAAGEHGSKFWCEIAARTAVEAATAEGWSARLLTLSRDGHTWEHAVAEFWSNQFGKWFVVDTDFNCIYEYEGVPLSGFELCHQGQAMQKRGKLVVRLIAPSKKSLPMIDLIPYYRYVHIDMRNDWYSRHLAEGSPAGGDLNTWWTSRPSLRHLLTAKRHVSDPALFNWAVNWVCIYALRAKAASGGLTSIEIGLAGYSPTFKAFEISFDNGKWHRIEQPKYVLDCSTGNHLIRARLLTLSGFTGPVSSVSFHVAPAG